MDIREGEWQEAAEIYTTKSFIIYTLHQILVN
jgi:hypothetical protein